SVGIHPPSLELFESLGLARNLIKEGVQITAGHAFANARKIGSLSFKTIPNPFRLILSLPQSRTEQILENALNQRNPEILMRNAKAIGIDKYDDHITLTYRQKGKTTRLETTYLMCCDGKNSFIKDQAGISFSGKSYPDTYVMGDFTDNTSFGSDAAVFLCNEGLIESFPLPQNRRRWVVKTDHYCSKVQRKEIEKALRRRIGHNLSDTDHFMLSSFGVEKRRAQPMVKDRIILCGDAAHVVSPIGGQGMNLGWLAARDLFQSLHKVIIDGAPAHKILPAFERRRRKAYKNTVKRSRSEERRVGKENKPFGYIGE